MAGTLYLLPNTLGARDAADPLPAVIPAEVQRQTAALDYLIAENAKTARAYLKKLSESTPLRHAIQQIEIRELNVNTPEEALSALLDPLAGGRDGGLLSEAGVPAVADPGANLVRLAHQRGIQVRPLVGPSSILLALMASGLNGQSFAFHGYLPIDAAARAARLKQLHRNALPQPAAARGHPQPVCGADMAIGSGRSNVAERAGRDAARGAVVGTAPRPAQATGNLPAAGPLTCPGVARMTHE